MFESHSKRKIKEAKRSQLCGHREQELDDKGEASLGIEKLETARSAFTNTTFLLIPFFSNSGNHGLVEVESPGGCAKAKLLLWTFIPSKISLI